MDVIKVCRDCYGYEPCLCGKHNYIEMFKFVYEAMKSIGKAFTCETTKGE